MKTDTIVWNGQRDLLDFSDHFLSRLNTILMNKSRQSDRVKSSFHCAAIVWKNRRILAVGNNRRKSHPLQQQYQQNKEKIFLHAEADSIIKTMNRYGQEILSECSIFVMRTTRTGEIAESKPCSGCLKFINAMDIQSIFWS